MRRQDDLSPAQPSGLPHLPAWSASSAVGAARKANADAWHCVSHGDSISAAVADGVSSLSGSLELATAASRAAVQELASQNSREPNLAALVGTIHDSARRAINDTGKPGATTLAAGMFNYDWCWVMSAGDSEVLVVQREGPAKPLFEPDHLRGNRNVLTRWVDGITTFAPHCMALPSLPLRICLVTDGVTQALDYREIADIVRAVPADEGAEALVGAALDRTAIDDTTAVVIGR